MINKVEKPYGLLFDLCLHCSGLDTNSGLRPFACKNNTLASRNLEQLAILAWRKFYLISFELFVYLTKWTFETKNIFQVMVQH